MAGRMWFGTKERMTWVKCPAIEADLTKGNWSTEGVFLNGGAYARKSAYSHKRYQFAWNLASHQDIYDILDYADGLYGQGLIYFLDPFAISTNVLPLGWAVPRLQAEDAPPLIRDANSRPTLVATAANTYAYPTQSAVFTLADGDVIDSVYIPVPPGYEFHFGVHGSATGTAEFRITTDEDVATVVTPLGVTSPQLTNTVISDTTGVTISAWGIGNLTVAGMLGQVLPGGSPAPTGRFLSGRGHSGCSFVGTPSINGYSAPDALDKIGASAVLIETGAWEEL